MSLFPKGSRIVLTGAAGRHGRMLLELLRRERPEWQLLATDMAPWPDCPVPFLQADLRDSASTTALLRGAEGVIHLGAVPGPSSTPPPGWSPAPPELRLGLEKLSQAEVLASNMSSSWNVFEGAARSQTCRRIVFSSSAFAFGWAHNPRAYTPLYLPMDELHPPLPAETYGLSKLLGEQAAACVARASQHTSAPLTVASLRFTNLVYPEDEHKLPWAAPSEARPEGLLMWHYTKAGDVARAHLLALETAVLGEQPHEAFTLAAPTTRFLEDTAGLVRTWFPGVKLVKGALPPGNGGLLCTDKARRTLGWNPTAVQALLRKS